MSSPLLLDGKPNTIAGRWLDFQAGDAVVFIFGFAVVDFEAVVVLVTLVVVEDVETEVDVVIVVVFVVGVLELVEDVSSKSGWAATKSSRSALTTVAIPIGSLGGSITAIAFLTVVVVAVDVEVEVVEGVVEDASFFEHCSSSGWML